MRPETLNILAEKQVQVSTLQVRLAEQAVGLAELRTSWSRETALPQIGSPLRIALGIAEVGMHTVFLGLLADALRLDGDEAQFTGRCNALALDAPAPFALYAPTPVDVVREVEKASGLPLLLPRKAPYLTTRIPRFISLASGREALDAMAQACRPCWQNSM